MGAVHLYLGNRKISALSGDFLPLEWVVHKDVILSYRNTFRFSKAVHEFSFFVVILFVFLQD